jgi:predicted RND superfamily exporter protein
VEKRFSSFIIQYRWALALISLVFCAYSISGLQHFRFDADPSLYFSKDNPRFQFNEKLEERYGKIHQVTLGLEFKDSIYRLDNLKILNDITREGWELPYIKRVESLANYAYSYSEGDELYVEELLENIDHFNAADLKRLEEIATSDDAIVHRLVSIKAPIALVRFHAAFPYINRVSEEHELTAAAQALVDRYEAKYPELNILITGNVISNTLTNETAVSESSTLVPLMYLVIYVLLAILLRSIFATFGIAVITVFSCTTALGLASHAGLVINLMSITCVNIIVTVAIAHCVHIYVYFLKAYRGGESKIEALTESFRINMQPIFLTSLTTGLGFLSLNLSDLPPAGDLGNITACGVLLAFVLSLTLLPAMIMLSPISNKQSKVGSATNQQMDKLADFIIRNRNKVGIASLAVSALFLSLAPMNVVNDNFTETLKKPHPFRFDNEKIDENFGGLYTIDFDFKAKPGSTISDPEYLQALDKFSQWLRQQEHINNVHSYTDIIKRLNQNMHGGDPSYYRIPDSQEEAAQYLLLYELSQPFGADLNDLVQPDKSATRLIVNIPSFDSIKVIALREKIKVWVEQNMPSYMHYSGEGLAVMWVFLGAEAFYTSMEGALFALFLISVILTIVFKSFRYGLISLIPNLLPAGIGYGAWYMISGNLDMGQMMVLSITIGIVVDDTVHFLSKYIRAKREFSNSSEDAIRYAFKHVGAPLWITTIVLVLGFALLISSSFQPNSNLGMLTALILTAALALDFFLLPPLLMWLDKAKTKTAH